MLNENFSKETIYTADIILHLQLQVNSKIMAPIFLRGYLEVELHQPVSILNI